MVVDAEDVAFEAIASQARVMAESTVDTIEAIVGVAEGGMRRRDGWDDGWDDGCVDGCDDGGYDGKRAMVVGAVIGFGSSVGADDRVAVFGD